MKDILTDEEVQLFFEVIANGLEYTSRSGMSEEALEKMVCIYHKIFNHLSAEMQIKLLTRENGANETLPEEYVKPAAKLTRL